MPKLPRLGGVHSLRKLHADPRRSDLVVERKLAWFQLSYVRCGDPEAVDAFLADGVCRVAASLVVARAASEVATSSGLPGSFTSPVAPPKAAHGIL